MIHKRPRHNARRRGLTLIELLLAVMITGMIGAAIAAMLSAVTYGTSTAKDIRSLVARNKALNARISAAIRGSTMVLEKGDTFVVLWINDADEDGEPSLLEIRRLDYDAANNEFSSYKAPADATEVYYSTSDDFESITDALMGSDDFPEELWAKNVDAVTLALDDADPQSASLLSYQVSFTAGDMSDTAIAAVALRN